MFSDYLPDMESFCRQFSPILPIMMFVSLVELAFLLVVALMADKQDRIDARHKLLTNRQQTLLRASCAPVAAHAILLRALEHGDQTDPEQLLRAGSSGFVSGSKQHDVDT